MKWYGVVTGLVLWSGLSGGLQAADFSYRYFEISGDVSATDNTSMGAAGDADGSFAALRASYEFAGVWHLRAGYSRESKSFANDVADTRLTLHTDQRFLEFGAGYHHEVSERTDVYAEALVLDTRVDHDLPVITPSMRGPPTVSKRVGVLEGQGFGVGLGTRYWIAEGYELEGRVGIVDILSEKEVTVAVGGRMHSSRNFALGAHVSFSKSSDANFDNIRKLGLSLRYQF